MKLVPAKDHNKALIEWLLAHGAHSQSEDVCRLRGERVSRGEVLSGPMFDSDGNGPWFDIIHPKMDFPRVLTPERAEAWAAEQHRGGW